MSAEAPLAPKTSYPNINKVGVELEGGWRNRVFLDANIHEDISLPIPEGYMPTWHFGEIASKPLPPEKAVAWMLKHYPLDIPPPVDGKSCGLHFHLSVHGDGEYNKLLSQTFYDTYLQGMGEVLKTLDAGATDTVLFHQRLSGLNRFARRLYAPSRQVWCTQKDSGRDAERRTLINYCHGLHGTVEFRLFPMFRDPAMSVLVLEATMSLVDAFLEARKGKHDRRVSRKAWVGDLMKEVG